MRLSVTTTTLEKISVFPATEAEEISQNVAALAVTPAMSVPLLREMGLPSKYLYAPENLAKAIYDAELTDQVDKYESRAKVVSMDATWDEEKGIMFPTVEVETNG